MSQRMKWMIGAALIVAAIGFGVSRPDVVEVELVSVQPGPLQVTIDEDGETRVRNHVAIAAPVTGRLLTGTLRAGDSVVPGQVVARMAPVPLDDRGRQQAEAGVAAAAAVRAQATVGVEQAELALSQAQRDLARLERLGAAGAIASRTVEAARTDVQVRQRERDAARSAQDAAAQHEAQARLALIGSDPSASSGIVAIRSPLRGRVLRVYEEHERVVVAGAPLLDVGSPDVIEIVVDVLSGDATRIRPGTPMTVRFPDGMEVQASVSRVEPAAFARVSPLGVEEQRVNVVATLDHPPPGVGDQFQVSTSLVLWSAESVLSVPSTSLAPTDEGWGVFAVERGRARLRTVTLGHQGARAVEVTSGLARGDEIIRHPDERISNGVRVASRRR